MGTPPDIRWRSLSLTHVEYPEGDLLGKLLAYSSLLPIVALIGCATLILFRRDLHTITFFIGLVLNEGVNTVLKYTIRQPRPISRETLYSVSRLMGLGCRMVYFKTVLTPSFNTNPMKKVMVWRSLLKSIKVAHPIRATIGSRLE